MRSSDISYQALRQFKSVKLKSFMNALERDGFVPTYRQGSDILYEHPDGRRLTIHYHPRKEIRNLAGFYLAATGWNEDDLKRLKLIK